MESESSSSALETYIEYLKSEKPKIDEVIKNLISVILGKSITRSDMEILLLGSTSYTPNQVLLCGKVLLKSIQNYNLMGYNTWASEYPQFHDQSGLDRMDELCRYRSLEFLRNRVITSNQSVNKFFGKSYFLWSKQWPAMKQFIISNSLPNGIVMDHINFFLETFETSLNRDDDIIWSDDFRKEVYHRSNQRKQEILERSKVKELPDDDDDEEDEEDEKEE